MAETVNVYWGPRKERKEISLHVICSYRNEDRFEHMPQMKLIEEYVKIFRIDV